MNAKNTSKEQLKAQLKLAWGLKYRPCTIRFDDSNKKQVYQNVSLGSENAYELVNDDTLLLIDVDSVDRENQRQILDGFVGRVISHCMKNAGVSCLLERSASGGLHLCLKIHERNTQSGYVSFALNVSRQINWEFKNSFLAHPTPGMQILYVPEAPAAYTSQSELKIFLSGLYAAFGGVDTDKILMSVDRCYNIVTMKKRTIEEVQVDEDSDEDCKQPEGKTPREDKWYKALVSVVSSDVHEFLSSCRLGQQVNLTRVVSVVSSRINNAYLSILKSFSMKPLYFVHLEIFINWLCDADKTRPGVSADGGGVFSKLADTKTWKVWTYSYVRLCAAIKLVHGDARGAYIEGSLSKHLMWTDPYVCYRKVTRGNLVGTGMSESDARLEFNQLCRDDSIVGFGEYSAYTLFVRFLEATLVSLKYDSTVLATLDKISAEFGPTGSETELLVKDFTEHRFPDGGLRIAAVPAADSTKGDDVSCAFIYLLGLPWIPACSPEFKLFVGQLYPNCRDVSKIPAGLARRATLNNNLRKWVNILPYSNGILDFCGTPDEPVIFRNYTEEDLVTQPMPVDFPAHEYVNLPGEEHILLLDNATRYGDAFCWFMCGLFGKEDNIRPTINPFQFARLLGVCILLASGILRTKKFQKCLFLHGCANNGKSTLIHMLNLAFREKSEPITSIQLFSRETFSHVEVAEKMFVTDNEVSSIYLDKFKSYIGDFNAPIATRKIYKTPVQGAVFNSFYVGACNAPVIGLKCTAAPTKATVDIAKVMDYGFYRRVYQETLYNLFTKVDAKMKYDINDPKVSSQIANGIVVYLCDVLRVFNISNLEASCNHIQSSIQQTRLFGSSNNPIIHRLVNYYLPIASLDLDVLDVIKRTAVLKLAKPILIRDVLHDITNAPVVSIPEQITKLLTTFSYSLSADQQQILDLIAVDDLANLPLGGITRAEIEAIKLPASRSSEKREDIVDSVAFLDENIPVDHRIRTSDQISATFATIVSNQFRKNPLPVKTRRAAVSDTYKYCTASSLFHLPTFLTKQ